MRKIKLKRYRRFCTFKVAKATSGEEVRLYAIRALSEHDSPAALDALIEIAKTADSYEVQMTAARGIGRRGDEQVAEVLMEILEQ